MNLINGSLQKLTLSPAHTTLNPRNLFFIDGGRRQSGIKAIMLLHFLLYISGMGNLVRLFEVEVGWIMLNATHMCSNDDNDKIGLGAFDPLQFPSLLFSYHGFPS